MISGNKLEKEQPHMGSINELKDFTRGQLDAALMKIGQDAHMGTAEGVQAFLRGDLIVSRRTPSTPRDFPIWKTIKLGTGLKTADDFRKAIKSLKFRISDHANDILGQPALTVSPTEIEVDLVLLTIAELGLQNGVIYRDICAKAKEFGLELCPAEVGPQLRLQYTDQPMGEWIVVAMDPITGSGGYPKVFDVFRRIADVWLNGYCGHLGNKWCAGNLFVFVRRK